MKDTLSLGHNQTITIMKVTLTLLQDRINNLKKHLGDDNVTTSGEPDQDGFVRVSFEVNSDWDVLCILHAGIDTGLALGLTRKPV